MIFSRRVFLIETKKKIIGGLWATRQAGNMAGAVVNGKTIVGFYLTSAAGGGFGVAGGMIYEGTQSLYYMGIANSNAIIEFIGGFATPYVPTTLPAALGYAGGYLWSCDAPGETCH